MKTSILLASLLAIGSLAHAGFPPMTTCTSHSSHIKISSNEVVIQTDAYPSEIKETFPSKDIEVKYEVLQELPRETYGCTSRVVSFKKVTISRKDGVALPSAYDRVAIDGVLTDYVICSTTYAWMPAQGETCFK